MVQLFGEYQITTARDTISYSLVGIHLKPPGSPIRDIMMALPDYCEAFLYELLKG